MTDVLDQSIEDELLAYLVDEDEEPSTERVAENYHQSTTATILVPVKVKYHHPSGSLYSFSLPDRETIEAALKEQA